MQLNTKLSLLFQERIANGLSRKALTSPSKWAEKYRQMGPPFSGPWSFTHHPWLRDMHDSKWPINIGQKSAQMGYTETLLNLAFFTIDILQENVLYILPSNTPDATNFSASRFDPALELSPHLADIFSNVKNVGHKRAGIANLYIRGSKSRAQLKSVPAPKLLMDEVDEFAPEAVPLAFERTAGQIAESILNWLISTPSVKKYGIAKYFDASTQDHFFFPCPRCEKYIELKWPDNFVIMGDNEDDPEIHKSHLICTECSMKLNHEDKPKFLSKGKWVHGFSQRESRGFYINQLYSCTVTPAQLASAYFKGQKDQFHEQEFFNSKLGIPHEPEGSRVTEEQLVDCTGGYQKLPNNAHNGFTTMGVDVGKLIHVEVAEWAAKHFAANDPNSEAKPRVLWQGTVEHFEQLDKLMAAFRIRCCVIDAQPDTRLAYQFAHRFPKRVNLCYYSEKTQVKVINRQEDKITITVNRTSWLDLSLGRFKNRSISIPRNVNWEYKEHMKEMVRIIERDKTGNPIARWIHTGPDHFCHARNYCEIALPLALGAACIHDVSNKVV